MLRAALALQAQLLFAGESQDGDFRNAAAAAMFKVFEIISGAPLTHPREGGSDWNMPRVHNSGNSEPLAEFVEALLSHGDDGRLRVLQQVAAARCGLPVDFKGDVDSAWWSSATFLMHAPRTPQPTTRRRHVVASASNDAPRHRYVFKPALGNALQHRFAWPSHDFSAVLQSWCCMGGTTQPGQVNGNSARDHRQSRNAHTPLQSLIEFQASACRSCPLTSLSLGIQPVLNLCSACGAAAQAIGNRSSAKGLLPLTALFIALVHQVPPIQTHYRTHQLAWT